MIRNLLPDFFDGVFDFFGVAFFDEAFFGAAFFVTLFAVLRTDFFAGLFADFFIAFAIRDYLIVKQ
jgi:hypothetical protein